MAKWGLYKNEGDETTEIYRLEKDEAVIVTGVDFGDALERLMADASETDEITVEMPTLGDVVTKFPVSWYRNAWGVAAIEEGGVMHTLGSDKEGDKEDAALIGHWIRNE